MVPGAAFTGSVVPISVRRTVTASRPPTLATTASPEVMNSTSWPKNGFELLDFRELYAPNDAVDHEYYDTVPADWAKRWPDEELWHARLRP